MKQQSLKINFLMNIILTMSMFIFPLITFPYISRVLLPIGTGKVSFATSFISYFTMFAQLGIPTYGIRVCAQVRDDREELTKTVQELLFISIIMTIISYIALFICLNTIPRLQADKILFVIVGFTILLTTIGMEWLYKALEQYTYITIRSILFKFIALIAMYLLVHNENDYITYGGITIFASSASYILNFINVYKYIDLKPRKIGDYNFKRHIKPIVVFFAMTCASTIYTNLDTVMLGFMKTDIDVGFYNAAIKIKMILVSIITSLGTVLLPRASYYVEKKQMREFYAIASKALNFVFVLASPMMIYFLCFAEEGVLFLSGRAFQNSIVPMQVLMPTILLIGITNIFGIQVLIPLGKEKIVLYSEIAGAITDVLLNLILIPHFAATGAAIGTLVAEFVVLVFQYVVLRNKFREQLLQIQYWKIALGIVLATILSLSIKIAGFGYFLTLVISACVYFAIYGLILLFTKEKMTKELFNQICSRFIAPK